MAVSALDVSLQTLTLSGNGVFRPTGTLTPATFTEDTVLNDTTNTDAPEERAVFNTFVASPLGAPLIDETTVPDAQAEALFGDSDPADGANPAITDNEYVTIGGIDYSYVYYGTIDLVTGAGTTDSFAVIQTIDSTGSLSGDYYALNIDNPLDPANGNQRFTIGDLSPTLISFGDIICFARGTSIRTPSGERPVETLCVGDLVQTLDKGACPIIWIGVDEVSIAALKVRENLRPIRIAAGALGSERPARDLVVSSHHRILIRSKIAERMFGVPEVFVAAKNLLALEGVTRVEPTETVAYFHLLLEDHQIVAANGAFAETLFRGSEALKTLSARNLFGVQALFPGGFTQSEGDLARPAPNGRMARKLVERHIKNSKPLFEDGAAQQPDQIAG